MRQFLLCCTVFDKKQYTVLDYNDKDDLVEKLNRLLCTRNDAVIWPLFNKADFNELIAMDQSLSLSLKGIELGSTICKIRYNGWIYEVEEIVPSHSISGYWSLHTNCGNRLFDPAYIEFI